jgi:Ni,Fe-hydrogenase III small subunit
MWVLRGLRNGVVTTRWPARHDSHASQERGPAQVLAQFPDGAAGLPEVCPTGAVSYSAGEGLRLDQGRCILCGRCMAARPDVFAWSQGPGVASLTPTALLTPPGGESGEELARVRAGLRQRTRALGRSVHIRHVDAGSDGSEEWEVLALLNPVYDVHRLGIFFTASPRHADVLLVTGAGARGMAAPVRRTYEAMPHPKIVIAAGTDAVSGGIVSPSYATLGGIGDLVPVDVWVPGSPPSPFQLLHALLLGLGRLPAEGAGVGS